MGITEKLNIIQSELKAPKDKFNDFGKYKYRSAESILEAVKPLLKAHGCILTLSDTMEQIGDRYYVRALAKLADAEDSITVSAYAREEEFKKGMDGSQITGTASSYARKYALNGLFAIDDTKDADTNEFQNARQTKYERQTGKVENPKNKVSTTDAEVMKKICQKKGCDVARLLGLISRETGYDARSIDDLTREQYVLADALIKKYYPDKEGENE